MGKPFCLNEVEIASIYYSNSGNLIVPIVTFILGQEWVLYGCVFMSVQLVFIWTHCKKIISREASYDWRKIVLNINMISIALGAILFFAQIHLPEILNNPLKRWRYDWSSQYDRGRNAFRRNGSQENFRK